MSGQSEDMTAKEKLLLWSQRMVEGYQGLRCDNFTTSWRDGRLFNAIIHRHRWARRAADEPGQGGGAGAAAQPTGTPARGPVPVPACSLGGRRPSHASPAHPAGPSSPRPAGLPGVWVAGRVGDGPQGAWGRGAGWLQGAF